MKGLKARLAHGLNLLGPKRPPVGFGCAILVNRVSQPRRGSALGSSLNSDWIIDAEPINGGPPPDKTIFPLRLRAADKYAASVILIDNGDGTATVAKSRFGKVGKTVKLAKYWDNIVRQNVRQLLCS